MQLVLLELGHAARTHDQRRHPRVPQRPGERHLRERLPAPGCYLVERADIGQVLLVQEAGSQRLALRRAGVVFSGDFLKGRGNGFPCAARCPQSLSGKLFFIIARKEKDGNKNHKSGVAARTAAAPGHLFLRTKICIYCRNKKIKIIFLYEFVKNIFQFSQNIVVFTRIKS